MGTGGFGAPEGPMCRRGLCIRTLVCTIQASKREAALLPHSSYHVVLAVKVFACWPMLASTGRLSNPDICAAPWPRRSRAIPSDNDRNEIMANVTSSFDCCLLVRDQRGSLVDPTMQTRYCTLRVAY
jgi:hypothetical protein